MNLLVSTNVYKPGQLARVIPHLHAFRGQIGVELFPMFDADCYEEELLHCLPEFEGIPVSFHGPSVHLEHCHFLRRIPSAVPAASACSSASAAY